jgi:chromate transporter
VEATRGWMGLSAPLQAISAAVVGLMAHLGLYFARHSLWPGGGGLWPDPWSLATMALAWFLLARRQWGVARTLLACGALGLLTHLVLA